MKKILMTLVVLLSLSLVGCTYKVQNEDDYNDGKKYLNLEDTKETTYSEKLSEAISILDGSNKIDKFKGEDDKQYNDFKYGMLDEILDDLNDKKEDDIDVILLNNESSIMELDELKQKQKDLYSDDYNKIIDEYTAIFTELYENYNGKNIDKSYSEKVNEIKEEYDVIKNKISKQNSEVLSKWLIDQMPRRYTIKGTIKTKTN